MGVIMPAQYYIKFNIYLDILLQINSHHLICIIPKIPHQHSSKCDTRTIEEGSAEGGSLLPVSNIAKLISSH
ncbi:unnamed protein product [Ambrosiozyma monospora]|uniref:Unnamed protein product n=1 Tax=Ambrosiozyma monospora TaxID=43982 RepID=A0A9W6YUD6_AMBMO|nr:unnamed protein product [Ambrosiozyma monospora]